MGEQVLYIGIDLGTFRSVMVSSDSHEEEELTVIGTPKDLIAKNFLKRDVLFGEQALKNRLALNLFRPLEHGVIKDTPEDRDFIAHFITHLINLSDPEEYDRVVAVIGAPAEASYVDKTAIFDAAAGTVNAAMIISEPFAVAYALDMIEHTLVIDIGAGTTDIARIYGTFPTDEDQVTIQEAGDWLDNELMELIRKKYTGAQVTKDMVRKWKEEVSYVGGDDREAMVELSVEGKKQVVDIGDLVNQACELIIPKIGNAIKRIVAGADPEYQPILRNNIILSGGGSLIEGVAARMADEISDIGDVNVWCVDDPINAVATGALQLAGEMPDDMFTAIN